MKSNWFLSSVAAGAALFLGSVRADASSISPIIAKGKHFFYESNHTEFFIRGVAYQQNYNAQTASFNGNSFTDPLADAAACKRDIPYLSALRTNVIRTYAINPKLNHDDCMNMFADAGIYIIADLSAPEDSITTHDPQWTTELFAYYVSVINDLSKYNNVLGFFAGNEVVNTPAQSPAAAFVKAAVRDTKAYIKQNIQRPIYVGYATADVPIRNELAHYFACGNPEDAVDFWGYNIYSWCDGSNYETSSYKERTDFFRDYPVPAFFAEYGCIIPPPRTFADTPVLYGPKMAPVWSGGIVYEYFQTANNYGLVTISGDKVTPLPGYKTLQQAIDKVDPQLESYDSASTGTIPSCPAENSQWKAKASPLPPPANEDLCNCLQASLSCVVKDSVALTAYGKQFKYICGQSPEACTGIAANGDTGVYGAYSVCSPKQKLSYVMNKYYEMQGKSSSACDFGGAAQTQSSSESGSCKSLLSAAGSNGKGQAPEPTSVPSGSTSSSSSSSSSSGPNAAAGLTIPNFGVYSLIAGLAAVGMLVF